MVEATRTYQPRGGLMQLLVLVISTMLEFVCSASYCAFYDKCIVLPFGSYSPAALFALIKFFNFFNFF